ncbi:hypothetical protein Goshw_019274 [Gossypium schwendimanii]|uniref:RNase H type-1 domain-containing protein n=1 Tax=Gossypium schwendimanii TaxID=34291 RepID=A0A7J9KM60_GOSSC|nr:hypothetical protein [Gossypium schwendimanii]
MVFKPMLPVPPSGKCWLKPPHDIVKINFDTVVSPEKIGVSMIVRDSDGFVLGGGGSVIDAKMTAAWAEFKALEESIKLAKTLRSLMLELQSGHSIVKLHYLPNDSPTWYSK